MNNIPPDEDNDDDLVNYDGDELPLMKIILFIAIILIGIGIIGSLTSCASDAAIQSQRDKASEQLLYHMVPGTPAWEGK